MRGSEIRKTQKSKTWMRCQFETSDHMSTCNHMRNVLENVAQELEFLWHKEAYARLTYYIHITTASTPVHIHTTWYYYRYTLHTYILLLQVHRYIPVHYTTTTTTATCILHQYGTPHIHTYYYYYTYITLLLHLYTRTQRK